MKTIFEHTQSNVLVIPQALFAMKDTKVLSHYRNSAIIYKNLKQNLVDVEFYTNTPCFIYIENGSEVLTTSEGNTVELVAGSSIFLAQGLNLHSSFVKKATALKAYLIFFDDQVIIDYLAKVAPRSAKEKSYNSYNIFCSDCAFSMFFKSIRLDITVPAYLHLKLEELLHLLAWQDQNNTFHTLLSAKPRIPPQKNLTRLLQTFDIVHLTVNDLAHLSGRSLSSLNRDFKKTYQVTPKKWLQEKKLSKAKQMLEENEFSVTDVALSIGYENVSAFIKAFKLRYGVTPKKISNSK